MPRHPREYHRQYSPSRHRGRRGYRHHSRFYTRPYGGHYVDPYRYYPPGPVVAVAPSVASGGYQARRLFERPDWYRDQIVALGQQVFVYEDGGEAGRRDRCLALFESLHLDRIRENFPTSEDNEIAYECLHWLWFLGRTLSFRGEGAVLIKEHVEYLHRRVFHGIDYAYRYDVARDVGVDYLRRSSEMHACALDFEQLYKDADTRESLKNDKGDDISADEYADMRLWFRKCQYDCLRDAERQFRKAKRSVALLEAYYAEHPHDPEHRNYRRPTSQMKQDEQRVRIQYFRLWKRQYDRWSQERLKQDHPKKASLYRDDAMNEIRRFCRLRDFLRGRSLAMPNDMARFRNRHIHDDEDREDSFSEGSDG